MSFQTPTRPHATRENVLTTTFIHLRFESTSACFPQACTTNYVQWPSILDNSSSTISHHGTRRTAPAWTTSPGTRASGGSPCWGRRWWPSLPKRAAMARSMRSACTLGIDWHKRTMHICRARSYRAQRKKNKKWSYRAYIYLTIRQRLDEVLGEYPYTLDLHNPHLDNKLGTALEMQHKIAWQTNLERTCIFQS